MTHTILEEKLAEFDKEFPELWGSNDGREGYDALVTGELKSFLRSFYFAILKSIREEVEGMKRVPDKPDLLDMSYNHALSDLQALLAKRKEKIK